MRSTTRAATAMIALAATLSAACQASSPGAARPAEPPVPAGAAAGPSAAGMPAHPSGRAKAGPDAMPRGVHRTAKPGAPVELSWRLTEVPAPGRTVALTLDFTALAALSGDVRLTGEPGLEVAGEARFGLPERVAGEHWTRRVEVTPRTAALRYLHVVVTTTDGRGERRMRGFAVPVGADSAEPRKAGGHLMRDVGGAGVVSLPAVETVRRPQRPDGD